MQKNNTRKKLIFNYFTEAKCYLRYFITLANYNLLRYLRFLCTTFPSLNPCFFSTFQFAKLISNIKFEKLLHVKQELWKKAKLSQDQV